MNNKVLIEASKVSFTVVLLVVLIGLLLAMGAVIFIGFNQKKRYRWLEGLFILPMFIPPSAIGYSSNDFWTSGMDWTISLSNV